MPKWAKDAKEFPVPVFDRGEHGISLQLPRPIFDKLGSPKKVKFIITKNGKIQIESDESM